MRNPPAALVAVLLLAGALPGAGLGQVLAPADPGRTFLETTDPLLRERARRVLLGRGDAALGTIDRALSGGDPRLREAAVFCLADLSGAGIEERLVRALADADLTVRIAALRALAIQGTDRLYPEVVAAATALHWAERRAAALALSRTRVAAAAELLAKLAGDPDSDVAAAALRGLLAAGTPATAALRAAFDPEDTEGGERILGRLQQLGDERDIPFLRDVLASAADRRLKSQAAAALAARGVRFLDGPHRDLLLRAAASGDPKISNPAIFVLLRERDAAGRALLAALPDADTEVAESWAVLTIGLLGPAARAPLFAIAAGAVEVTPVARAAAIHALRRFRTAETTAELLWIYSPDLPRPMREGLCAAFEDLPRSDAARSGLVDVLEDPDGNLRLRAFRILLQYGTSTVDEINWLLQRILAEQVDWVRQRMSRLLATYARGEGARRFAERMVAGLDQAEPYRSDARDALENLQEPGLREAVARAVLKRHPAPLDFPMLRLLTRLKGPEADAAVAAALEQALDDGATDRALDLLIALRAGGGPGVTGAARRALSSDAGELRTEALRTLLARGDERGFEAFAGLYDSLSGEQRVEFVGLVESADVERIAALLRSFLEREPDELIRVAIIERAGELRAPLTDALVAQLDEGRTPEFLIRVAEALAMIGGADAKAAVRDLFERQLFSALERGLVGPDDGLLIESLAQAAARTGAVELAAPLASLLFLRIAELEPLQYDTDAAFPFEVTILEALLNLARTSNRLVEVAAAIEVEVDQAAEAGDLYLLPKTLFVRLVQPLEKRDTTLDGVRSAFDPLRANFLELAYRLPPRGDRRELPAVLRLAELATAEQDHRRAAALLEHALLLLDFHAVEGTRFLQERLGFPAPLVGFAPEPRLRANVSLAEARACRVMGENAQAREHYAAAAGCAPFDAWLHLALAAELRADDLDRDGAARHVAKAFELAPFDPDLVSRAARLFAWLGNAAAFDSARERLEELRDCGLARDRTEDRLGLAESLLALGRTDAARAEVAAAIALDPAAATAVQNHADLAPLLK